MNLDVGLVWKPEKVQKAISPLSEHYCTDPVSSPPCSRSPSREQTCKLPSVSNCLLYIQITDMSTSCRFVARLVSYFAHNRDAELKLCTETPNVYIIISHERRSTTPPPLPPVPFNCKAKGVCILTLALWISALMPTVSKSALWFLPLKMDCKWSRGYGRPRCTYWRFLCIYVCILRKRTACVLDCMYVYIHFYPLCLMSDHCTFLLACSEFENVTDGRRFLRTSVNKPKNAQTNITDPLKDKMRSQRSFLAR